MGQLERYGLYVLVVVIFLILGVAIMGGDPESDGSATPRSNLVVTGGPTSGAGDFTGVDTSTRLREFFGVDGVRGRFTTPQTGDGGEPGPEIGPVGGDTVAPERTTPGAEVLRRPVLTHVVRKGDSFSKIARELYNDESKRTLIQAANPGVDPAKMRIGTELVIPDVSTVAVADAPSPDDREVPAEAGGVKIHVVKRGELMGTIAKLHYGRSSEWRRIAEANPEVRPERMRDGTRLRIPPLN